VATATPAPSTAPLTRSVAQPKATTAPASAHVAPAPPRKPRPAKRQKPKPAQPAAAAVQSPSRVVARPAARRVARSAASSDGLELTGAGVAFALLLVSSGTLVAIAASGLRPRGWVRP
jgi:hypothetical protein